MPRTLKLVFALLSFAVLCLSTAITTEADTLIVSGQANIFGANRPAPSATPAPGDPSVPGSGGVPAPFATIASGTNLVLTFQSVVGTTSPCCGQVGPDGGDFPQFPVEHVNSFDGISGIRFEGREQVLVGVFTNGDPSGQAAPAMLIYNVAAGDDARASYSPLLRQVFFIGDGLTGTSTGSVQQFFVPTGATRLYLGFADAPGFNGDPGRYDDNSGSLVATFTITGQQPSAVPEPATMLLLGTGLAGVSAAVRRRRGSGNSD